MRVVANSTKLTALEDSSGSCSDSDDCNEGEESDSEPEHELDSDSDSDEEDELDSCGRWVCLQEDGAPGHGFNNKATAADGSAGVGTAFHDRLEIAAMEQVVCDNIIYIINLSLCGSMRVCVACLCESVRVCASLCDCECPCV